MKRIAILGAEPAVLRDFRVQHPDATWDEFKSQAGSDDLFNCLSSAQGHICAYCEIQITRPTEGGVEHYQPKSSDSRARNLHLDFSNLLACSEGGTVPWKIGRSERPIKMTMHCGALKGSQSPEGQMVDPRTLPAAGVPWKTDFRGYLVVDPEGCASAGLDANLAERTVAFLGLNRPVLVRLRLAVLDDLLKTYGDASPEAELLPDGLGRLQPFWSTVRSFGGCAVEPFIAANVERIPGLAGPPPF